MSSSNSASGTGVSSDTSEGSSSHGSVTFSFLPAPGVPPEEAEASCALPSPADEIPPCAWFLNALSRHPVLRRYEQVLRAEGFDSHDTFRHLAIEHMAHMQMPTGVRLLCTTLLKELGVSSSFI